jgi:hypothetical protein
MKDTAAAVAEDQCIWHYRQFAEFVAILQKEKLWFSRLDRLRDPLEGLSGRQTKFHEKADAATRKGCVSCWSMDDEESELMWHAYAPGNGVAIRSKTRKLKASLKPSGADKLMFGAVEYDYNWSRLPESFAFIKGRAFKWEQEFRAFLPYEPKCRNGSLVDCTYTGTLIAVDLHSLIEEVWLAPYSSNWFNQVVSKEMEKWGYAGIPVKTRPS